MQEPSDIRVAVLTSYKVYPAAMGGQKAISKLYSYLSKEISVTLLLTEANAEPEDFKGRYYKILSDKATRYCDIYLFKKIKKIIEAEKITHLILEHPYFGWLGVWLQKRIGVKLVIRSHNIESLRFKSFGKSWWRILWYYEKWTHRKADLSFYITEEDRQYALLAFGLKQEKTQLLTYGTGIPSSPPTEDRMAAKEYISSLHAGIQTGNILLLFNGSLNYTPNVNAIKFILEKLLPALKNQEQHTYKIIICGRGLSDNLSHKLQEESQIVLAGFVPAIEPYLLGADIFVNPVEEGGGIKTKLVEAIAYGLTAVSTANGAIGIPLKLTGEKLFITSLDGNKMTDAIKQAVSNKTSTPAPKSFYTHFYWKNIVGNMIQYLKEA